MYGSRIPLHEDDFLFFGNDLCNYSLCADVFRVDSFGDITSGNVDGPPK